MYWNREKELTPEEVKKLPPDAEVRLEWRDRHGERSWLEGHVVQSGKKKVFLCWTPMGRLTRDIKAYKGKRWIVFARTNI